MINSEQDAALFAVVLGKCMGQRERVAGREHCTGKEILGAISFVQAFVQELYLKKKPIWMGKMLKSLRII